MVLTIRKKRKQTYNALIGFGTLLLAIGTGVFTYSNAFSLSASWIDFEVLYENNGNPQIQIKKHLLDMGALGYKDKRTVKMTPFLAFWNHVEEIDLLEIQEQEWTYIGRTGKDIKFP